MQQKKEEEANKINIVEEETPEIEKQNTINFNQIRLISKLIAMLSILVIAFILFIKMK